VTKLGLESFGDEGDPFDPNIHEAVMHTESDDVTAPTATTVMRKGYRHGDRLLRPAMVGVSEPTNYTPDQSTESDSAKQDETAEAVGETGSEEK
jgi:molecular chaperone GrpE